MSFEVDDLTQHLFVALRRAWSEYDPTRPRRAVLVMHELDDVPVAEVASVLSIPPFTVYSRLRKARSELQVGMRRL